MKRSKIKYRRMKIKRKHKLRRRTRIKYKRDRHGLYPGMNGTVTNYGRTFLLPTKDEERKCKLYTRIRMYICFGRQTGLSEKMIRKLLPDRISYLKRYRSVINIKNQILNTEEENDALLGNK